MKRCGPITGSDVDWNARVDEKNEKRIIRTALPLQSSSQKCPLIVLKPNEWTD